MPYRIQEWRGGQWLPVAYATDRPSAVALADLRAAESPAVFRVFDEFVGRGIHTAGALARRNEQ